MSPVGTLEVIINITFLNRPSFNLSKNVFNEDLFVTLICKLLCLGIPSCALFIIPSVFFSTIMMMLSLLGFKGDRDMNAAKT